MSNDRLGPLLRLRGLRLADLPQPHADVDELRPLMLALLQEAHDLLGGVDAYYAARGGGGGGAGAGDAGTGAGAAGAAGAASAAAGRLWKSKGRKRYTGKKTTGGPVTIEVSLLERVVPAATLHDVFVAHAADPASADPASPSADAAAPAPVPVPVPATGAGAGASAGPAAAPSAPPAAAEGAAGRVSAQRATGDSGLGSSVDGADRGEHPQPPQLPQAPPQAPPPALLQLPARQKRGRRGSRVTPETWFCRRSLHANSATPGSASWAEFHTYMKEQHVKTEEAMTPAVVATQQTIVWRNAWNLPQSELSNVDEGRGPWTDFTLAAVEMQHKVAPALLQDRVFPVLQMTCRSVHGVPRPEFLIISVTLRDWETVQLPNVAHVLPKLSSRSKVVLGAYVSVERFRTVSETAATGGGSGITSRRNNSSGGTSSGNASSGGGQIEEAALVEWVMATASDARGSLPPMIQTPAIPGKIAQDVPLFLKWLAGERQRVAEEPAVQGSRRESVQDPGEGAAQPNGQSVSH